MDSLSLDTFVGGVAPALPVIPKQAPIPRAKWSYEEAFKRNRGLITESEQEKLRNSRVAIAGMGGVGGVHLITLARLGIGKFTIADPDVFEVANFNRQYGATISNLGRNKAEVMAEAALDINPELELRVIAKAIDVSNVDQFLDGADLFVDGLDFFTIETRRLIFRRAAQRGLWAVTAGPLGFSTAWLEFDPAGMSFDEYFDLTDSMEKIDQLAAFAVGLTPKATHLRYTDFSFASVGEQTGPSTTIGCQLSAGVVGTEVLKILLNRGTRPAAPSFLQFDPYHNRLVTSRLRLGNRSPWQRLKRRVLRNRFAPPSRNKSANISEGAASFRDRLSQSVPPIHRFVPIIFSQTFSQQTLERIPEPHVVTDQEANVLQYDQVMSTKLAIAYAVALETIYRCRPEPFGGNAIDLACGPGHMSLLMAKFLRLDGIDGVDLSAPMVAMATKNALNQQVMRARFSIGDVTQLANVPDASYDLCTFCDAAHHLADLTLVGAVLAEMDRITKPEGLVVVMDLARLKSARLTEAYVELLGMDYRAKGLANFLEDFRASMYAAWTMQELASAVPVNTPRQWMSKTAAGLPTIQFLLGAPKSANRIVCRRGFPWNNVSEVLAPQLRNDWRLMRATLFTSRSKQLNRSR